MFCYQCEQTAGGTGCTKASVCGKNEDIASLQDTLIIGLKGIAATPSASTAPPRRSSTTWQTSVRCSRRPSSIMPTF